MRSRKLTEWFKKQWAIVWLITAVLLVSGVFAFAEYGRDHNKMKRVIATGTQRGQLFASDLLESDGTPLYIKAVVIDEEEENAPTTENIPFQIWNWNPMSPTVPYAGQLKYTIVAKLTDKTGSELSQAEIEALTAESFSIDILDTTSSESGATILDAPLTKTHRNNSTSAAGPYVFTSGSATTAFKYRVVFPRNLIDKEIYVTLEAIPDPEINKELETLSVTIGLTKATQDLDTGWTGSFVAAETADPTSYDGFNYTISGNGEANIYLYWRSDLLTINPWFLQDSHYGTAEMQGSQVKVDTGSGIHPEGVTPAEGETWSRVKMHVNSEPFYLDANNNRHDTLPEGVTEENLQTANMTKRQLTRYDIPFYIRDYESYLSWTENTMTGAGNAAAPGFILIEETTASP